MAASENKIRIIGGIHKGRKLTVYDLPGLRPTPDRVRETIFNWLGNKVQGSRVLDLFAGSGALGFEACSRGAAQVILNELNPDICALLEVEARQMQARNVQIKRGDALANLKQIPGSFDLIFIDPPYHSNLAEKSLNLILPYQKLSPGGLIYVEMNAGRTYSAPGFEWICEDQAGQVKYGLCRKSSLI